MDYPKYITDAINKFDGKSVFYFLEIESASEIPVYKFGITVQCKNRLCTHHRKLCIKRVVKIIDCTYDSVMRFVETEFKRYAKSIGVMVTVFENTEILVTKEIDVYVDRVEKAVIAELLKPQPKNVRDVPANLPPPTNLKVDNKTCINCMKVFQTPADLERHKNRKEPCVIRTISDADKNNPLRCQHCNKLFTNNSHLTRHYKKCKIKNNKIPNVCNNVNFEETIKTMQEQAKKYKDIKFMFSMLRADIEILKAENKELRESWNVVSVVKNNIEHKQRENKDN
jgi:uncharacterized C2H2 Zn-finger protein